MAQLSPSELTYLETLIDTRTLSDVVIALAVIAEEKAQHVQDSWQDRDLAKSWQRDADKLSKIFNRLVN